MKQRKVLHDCLLQLLHLLSFGIHLHRYQCNFHCKYLHKLHDKNDSQKLQ